METTEKAIFYFICLGIAFVGFVSWLDRPREDGK